MGKQQYFVRGTSCTSCEVVIEREIKKERGVNDVTVSHKNRTLDIETTDECELDQHRINALLKHHGYFVGNKDKAAKQKQSIQWKKVGGALILVFALYLALDRLGVLRYSPSSTAPAGFMGVFVIGLIASVSSCMAVVGGLVAAVSGAVAKDMETLKTSERLRPHLLFNLGRVGGFFLLGMGIGFIGNAVKFSSAFNGLFILAIAVLMMIIGVNLLNILPFPVVGMPKWLAHKVHDLAESKDTKAPLLLGAMTFFLPCGFTQSMQLYALTLGNPIQSGLVMSVFALGTAPVLFGIGGLTSTTSGKTLRKMTYAAGLIVLVLGFSNAMNGLALFGISPEKAFAKPAPVRVLNVVDGKQYIQMEVTEYATYAPNTLTVQEGVPVEWSIFGADFMGCANTLILPAFKVNTVIRPGMNTVRFTPTKSGRYTFSCSMGMVRGTMIVQPAT